MYPGLSQQQLLCFHPGKSESNGKPCFPIWKGRAAFSKVITADIFLPAIRPKLIRRLSRRCGSFWISFSGLIIVHLQVSLSNWSFADGELYEVAYVAHGREALVCHALQGNKRAVAAASSWSILRHRLPKSAVTTYPVFAPYLKMDKPSISKKAGGT